MFPNLFDSGGFFLVLNETSINTSQSEPSLKLLLEMLQQVVMFLVVIVGMSELFFISGKTGRLHITIITS